jgi:hypothetical protein
LDYICERLNGEPKGFQRRAGGRLAGFVGTGDTQVRDVALHLRDAPEMA